MDRVGRAYLPKAGGRFAQNENAAEATAAEGRAIIEASLSRLDQEVRQIKRVMRQQSVPFVDFEAAATIWARIEATKPFWKTLNL